MTPPPYELAAVGTASRLIVLLHGVGARGDDLLPLGRALQQVFPSAAVVVPHGTHPFDGGGPGRQWFSIAGVTEANRSARITAALPAVQALLAEAQQRWGVGPEGTLLGGFSQGAILSLELATQAPVAVASRVLAFAGRFAQAPTRVPPGTTFHLLHGAADPVIAADHARDAAAQLRALGAPVTLDIAAGVGHGIAAEQWAAARAHLAGWG